MSPGLPGALFIAVALTMPTTCYLLAHQLHRRPKRPGFWWRVGALQGATCLTALTLLASLPTAASSAGSAVLTPAPVTTSTPAGNNDRARGYEAGRALAADRHHRDSPPPKPEALAAMAQFHGRNEPPAFAEGFRRGYLAGLPETHRP